MEVISLLLTAVFVLGCLYLVLMPLFKEETFLDHTKKSALNTGVKEALLTTLNEIEFEYKMEKMSETDYRQLKRQYESQVAKIMQDEEEQGAAKAADQDVMDEVEREIAASLRKRNKGEGK